MVVPYPTLHNVFNTDIAKEKSILMKNVFEFCLLLLFFSSCDKDNNNHTTQNGCDIKKIYSSSIHNSDGMTTIIENGRLYSNIRDGQAHPVHFFLQVAHRISICI